MSDNIQIIVSTSISQESIAKMKQQLNDLGKNINVSGKPTITKQLFKGSEQDIALFKRNMENAINRLQIGKESIFKKEIISKGLSSLKSDISSFGTVGGKSAKELRMQFSEFATQVKKASVDMHSVNKEGYSFGEMLATSAKKYSIWLGLTTLLMQSLRTIGSGIQYIIDLDNAMNEIRIVTGKTQEEVSSLADSYGVLAEEMSVTTLEITKQATELFRQGLAQQEVEERMKGIIKYAKISGLGIDESGKIITATMNATGRSIDDVTNIFALLGDATASGSDEIGQALQAVASNADVAGLSLERASAYIATISSISRQSASTVGRSLSSVLSRYQSIKEKGFSEEDSTNLNQVTKALKSIGINATDSEGQLRNFGDILDELGPKFNELNTNQRNYIATTLFGTYQMNRGIILLSNYSQAQNNYAMALDSAGVAQQKFNVYQESTQAHIDRMTASWQNLAKKIIDSDIIKTFIDIAAGAADAIPIVLALTAAVVGFFIAIKIGLASTAIQTWLGGMIAGLGATTVAATAATVAFGTLAGAGIGGLIIAGGLLIKYLAKEVQHMNELKRSVDELNSAYAELGDNPTDEQMARYENASKQRLALIDNEIEKLKERKKWESSASTEYGFNPEAPQYFKNISAWFGDAGKNVDEFWTNLVKTTDQKLMEAEEEKQKIARLNVQAEQKMADAIGKRTNATELAARQTKASTTEMIVSQEELKKYDDAISESSQKINDYESNLSSIADLNKEISDGQAISKETLLDLLSKYPEYTQQIMNAVGSKKTELSLTELLFEANKEKYLAEQTLIIEEIKNKAKLNQLDLDAIMLSREKIRTILATPGLGATVTSDLEKSLASLAKMGGKELADIEARIASSSIVKGLKIGDFNLDTKTGDTGTGGPPKDPNADAIKAVTEAQSAITEVIKTEVEKRKDAIEDYYDSEIEKIDNLMEANKKLWAQEDFDKTKSEQEDAIKKLNAEKSKYIAAALSGDLVAVAKVKEIDEEIAENKKKMAETQLDRDRQLQTEALETMKSAKEKEKETQLDSLNTIYDETQITSNAIQALFATNLAGFETLLSTYLSKLGLAEGEIKRIVGSVAGSFGSAQAGVGVAKGAGVSAGEFGSFAEGGKSPMQVAMEAYGKYSAAVVKADLAKLIALQASWATAKDKAAVNHKANEIRAKYGISDPMGYKYQAWSYVGSFASGGVNDSSGWARLHGTAARPEYILNYDQAKEAVMGNYSNTPLRNLANTTNNNGDISMVVNFNGPVDKAAVPSVRQAIASEFQKLFVKGGQSRPLRA